MLAVTLALGLLAAPPPASGVFTAIAGDYAVSFSAAHAWCIHEVSYRGQVVIHSKGSNGTVITTGKPVEEGNKSSMIGADQSTGGREEVSDVTISVDGKEVLPQDGGRYEGQEVVVHKASKLAELEQLVTVTVKPDRIVEQVHLSAPKGQPAKQLLMFLHNWQPTFQEWAVRSASGELTQQSFEQGAPPNQSVLWGALYEPDRKLGFVTCHPAVLKLMPGGSGMTFWGRPNYRKQAFTLGATAFPKGFTGDYTLCLRAFDAEPDQWVARAQALAEETYHLTPSGLPDAPPAAPATTSGPAMTVNVGDWSATFSEATRWTIDTLAWQGQLVQNNRGSHGVAIDTGKPVEGQTSAWIAAKLVGGGVEEVTELTATLDHKPCEMQAGPAVTGSKFHVLRRSTMAGLDQESELTIEPTRIVERQRLTVGEAQPIRQIYLFMQNWVPAFTQWAVHTTGDETLSGELSSDGLTARCHDVDWAALYDPARQVAMVSRYAKPVIARDKGLGTIFVDRQDTHKQCLAAMGAGTIQPGEVIEGTVELTALSAAPDVWQRKVAEATTK